MTQTVDDLGGRVEELRTALEQVEALATSILDQHISNDLMVFLVSRIYAAAGPALRKEKDREDRADEDRRERNAEDALKHGSEPCVAEGA